MDKHEANMAAASARTDRGDAGIVELDVVELGRASEETRGCFGIFVDLILNIRPEGIGVD